MGYKTFEKIRGLRILDFEGWPQALLKSVLVGLALRVDDKTMSCFLLNETLVRELCWGLSSIQRAYPQLETLGLIEREKRGGMSTRFTVIPPGKDVGELRLPEAEKKAKRGPPPPSASLEAYAGSEADRWVGFKTFEKIRGLHILSAKGRPQTLIKGVLMALALRADDKTMSCFSFSGTLARELCWGLSSVRKTYPQLEALGLIKREERRPKKSKYTVIIPEGGTEELWLPEKGTPTARSETHIKDLSTSLSTSLSTPPLSPLGGEEREALREEAGSLIDPEGSLEPSVAPPSGSSEAPQRTPRSPWGGGHFPEPSAPQSPAPPVPQSGASEEVVSEPAQPSLPGTSPAPQKPSAPSAPQPGDPSAAQGSSSAAPPQEPELKTPPQLLAYWVLKTGEPSNPKTKRHKDRLRLLRNMLNPRKGGETPEVIASAIRGAALGPRKYRDILHFCSRSGYFAKAIANDRSAPEPSAQRGAPRASSPTPTRTFEGEPETERRDGRHYYTLQGVEHLLLTPPFSEQEALRIKAPNSEKIQAFFVDVSGFQKHAIDDAFRYISEMSSIWELLRRLRRRPNPPRSADSGWRRELRPGESPAPRPKGNGWEEYERGDHLEGYKPKEPPPAPPPSSPPQKPVGNGWGDPPTPPRKPPKSPFGSSSKGGS